MQEKEIRRNAPTPPTKEQLRWLRGLMAIADEVEATADEIDAECDSFEAISKQIKAIITDIQASKTRLQSEVAEFQRLGKHRRLVLHAGKCGASGK